MITLTFNNGLPNDSLEIGDSAYYIPQNTPNQGSSSGYGGSSSIESSQIFIGTIVAIKTINTGFSLFVTDTPSEAIAMPTFPPKQNDFILFAKNSAVETTSIKGYYLSATMRNNSRKKACLYAVSCDVVESSK